MKYSIIYAVVRPEISEKLSVGLIIVDGDNVNIRYSQKKLDVLKKLFTEKEHRFVSRVIGSLRKKQSISSADAVNYLSRYSNNLIAVSPLQNIDIAPSEQNKEWLYRNYVYDRTHKTA